MHRSGCSFQAKYLSTVINNSKQQHRTDGMPPFHIGFASAAAGDVSGLGMMA